VRMRLCVRRPLWSYGFPYPQSADDQQQAARIVCQQMQNRRYRLTITAEANALHCISRKSCQSSQKADDKKQLKRRTDDVSLDTQSEHQSD
jgi:hypothetical protein